MQRLGGIRIIDEHEEARCTFQEQSMQPKTSDYIYRIPTDVKIEAKL